LKYPQKIVGKLLTDEADEDIHVKEENGIKREDTHGIAMIRLSLII